MRKVVLLIFRAKKHKKVFDVQYKSINDQKKSNRNTSRRTSKINGNLKVNKTKAAVMYKNSIVVNNPESI